MKAKRHAVAAIIAAGLMLPHAAPAAAAKPKAPPKPVLTCKTKGADGFSYTIMKAGKGAKPGAGDKVEVNYSGRLQADGSEFDSGKGIKFKVGRVIAGFARGLQLMQPGSKYRLCIPAALGYGAEGAGDSIPANADLVFEVELLSFSTPPPKPVVAMEARSCDLTTASGLSYAVARQGSGRSPAETDVALVDITTFNPGDGTIVVKEDWEKIPVAKAAGQFAEALALMQVGGSYRICFPGSEGPNGEKVPPLNIIVDLIDVRPAPVVED